MSAVTNMHSDLGNRLEIKASVLHIPLGATTHDVACPWCGHSKSFSVTKTFRGDILFLCHRASCSESGYIRDKDGSVRNSGTPTAGREFSPRMFDTPTIRVGGEQLANIMDSYGLTEDEISWAGWLFCPSSNRLAMPVYSPLGVRRGIVAKGLSPNQVPKSLTFKEVDEPWMGWYLRDLVSIPNSKDKFSTVVVVEDLISALKASRFYPTVALMGTHISHNILMELTALGERIVLSLDSDATQKAYDYTEQLACYGNFCAVPLSKDVKDMTQEELGDWSERL